MIFCCKFVKTGPWFSLCSLLEHLQSFNSVFQVLSTALVLMVITLVGKGVPRLICDSWLLQAKRQPFHTRIKFIFYISKIHFGGNEIQYLQHYFLKSTFQTKHSYYYSFFLFIFAKCLWGDMLNLNICPCFSACTTTSTHGN